jgi:formamidopyrimidine-DNA glycosylase
LPELPDVLLYLHSLRPRIVGERLERVRVTSPFVLRSVDPPLSAVEGRHVTDLGRLGKRIVWHFEGDLYLVIHLMIAGRLRFKEPGAALPGKLGLAAFDFPAGTVILTEAGSTKRASIHLVAGRAALEAHDPGGLDVLTADAVAFASAIRSANHTLKRSLTDPHVFSGIGNAYSDEILHHARLSPVQLTHNLSDEEVGRLYESVRAVLTRWITELQTETGNGFPEKVTAFRPGMAVHGRYGKPCPACGAPVQRIRYAANEANYCARCQTGGRLLSDRSLSRLLKRDWPRTVEEMELKKIHLKSGDRESGD